MTATSHTDPDAYQHHRVADTPANRFQGHLLISDQVSAKGVAVVWRELEQIIRQNTPGAVVEFGCYAGTTSLFIRRLLDQAGQSSSREFHVYDSFAGLPPKSLQDNNAAGIDFEAGKLAVSKKVLLAAFRAANLAPPIVHKGWFSDLDAQDVPQKIAFAFLDGDFYDSIYTSLQLTWPRLEQGGSVLIDDYGRPDLPGVQRAVQDYFRSIRLPVPPVRTEQNIALLHKN
jgi:O-methyltransferase